MLDMNGFWITMKPDQKEHFINQYFDALPNVFSNFGLQYARAFANTLFPNEYTYDALIVARTQDIIDTTQQKVLKRLMIEHLYNFNAILKCQAKSRDYEVQNLIN